MTTQETQKLYREVRYGGRTVEGDYVYERVTLPYTMNRINAISFAICQQNDIVSFEKIRVI